MLKKPREGDIIFFVSVMPPATAGSARRAPLLPTAFAVGQTMSALPASPHKNSHRICEQQYLVRGFMSLPEAEIKFKVLENHWVQVLTGLIQR